MNALCSRSVITLIAGRAEPPSGRGTMWSGVPTADHQLDRERLPQHRDRLFRTAIVMTGSRQDAEDLVQETYVRVLRQALRVELMVSRRHPGPHGSTPRAGLSAPGDQGDREVRTDGVHRVRRCARCS